MKVFIVGNEDYRHVIIHKRISDSGFVTNPVKCFRYIDFDEFIKGEEKTYVIIISNFPEKIELNYNLGLSIPYVEELNELINILRIDSEQINGIIYMSDLCIYGEPRYIPPDETHFIDVKNNLSLAYHFCECLLNDFYSKFRIPTIILRCPWVIGTAYNIPPFSKYGFILKNNLFYNLLERSSTGEKAFSVDVHNNQLSNNIYIHISDLANAINRCVEVMEVDRTFGIMNLGSEINCSGREMISLFESIFDHAISVNKVDSSFAPNYGFSCHDKAMQILSPWVPKWTMEETIKFSKQCMELLKCSA